MELPELAVFHEPYPLTPEFRQDWERLYAQAPGANVFSTLEWMEEGWRLFAAESDIIRPARFRDASGRTVAMALHKEVRSRRAWGHVVSWRTIDYNAQRIAPVLAIDAAHLAAALIALHRDVAGKIDVFDFFKLDPLGDELHAVVAALEARGLHPALKVFNEQPQLRLNETWDAYYQSHSRIFWKTPRRMRRRMEETHGAVTYRRFRTPEDYGADSLDAMLAKMDRVFARSWQYETLSSDTAATPAKMSAFYQGVARSGWQRNILDMNLLCAGDRVAAFDLNFVERDTVYMVCGMYDVELRPFSPGRILFIDELEDGHGRGDRIYEFGGEFLSYKEEWTEVKIPSYHLRIRGKTLTARLQRVMEMV